MKTNWLMLILALALPVGAIAGGPERNPCDDINDKIQKEIATLSESELEDLVKRRDKCYELFGKSDYAKAQARKIKEREQDETQAREARLDRKTYRKQHIIKRFSAKDIREHEMNPAQLPVVMDLVRDEWHPERTKELSDADEVCMMFGFEEAIFVQKSKLYRDVDFWKGLDGRGNPKNDGFQAVIMEKGTWSGKLSQEVFKFGHGAQPENVRLLEEIVCIRKRKQDEPEQKVDKEIKTLFDLWVVDGEDLQVRVSPGSSEEDRVVLNGSRRSGKQSSGKESILPEGLGSIGK